MLIAERVERETLVDRGAVLTSGADVELPSVWTRLTELDESLAAPFHVMESERAELMRELGLRAS